MYAFLHMFYTPIFAHILTDEYVRGMCARIKMVLKRKAIINARRRARVMRARAQCSNNNRFRQVIDEIFTVLCVMKRCDAGTLCNICSGFYMYVQRTRFQIMVYAFLFQLKHNQKKKKKLNWFLF